MNQNFIRVFSELDCTGCIVLLHNDLELGVVSNKITIRDGFLEEMREYDGLIHVVLIATKPDIIKQAPIILELRQRGKKLCICHTGQHYDWNLSGGLEQEFDIVPDVNLNITGSMHEKHAQLIFRLGELLRLMKGRRNEILPYIHGDTLTASAGGIASYMNQCATCHVEAGLRTLTPPKELFMDLLKSNIDVSGYYDKLQNVEFASGSNEPYPEQFDTRSAAPTAGIHFASVELNRQSLLNEGYPKDRIFTVGNTVSDSVKFAEKHVSKSTIFEKYPSIEDGSFVRFCIHRRENVSNFQRFKSIYLAMKKLIEEGQNVLLISLGATEKAFESYGLKNDVDNLASRYKNFIYSPVWPFYTDVIAATKKCGLIATDSGSMQEECNIMGVACATLRFNSDRPETVMAGSNILAPPIREDVVYKVVDGALNNDDINKRLCSKDCLYGTDVCKKIVDVVDKISRPIFRLDHQRLGFSKLDFWDKRKIEW